MTVDNDAAEPAGLTVLMPLAGAGSRFAAGGAVLPKPLIDVAGRPMVYWALASARAAWPACRPVFVVLRRHETQFGISAVLRGIAPDAAIAVAEAQTGGSAQTCLLARDLVPGGRLLVLDCDLAFRARAFAAQVNRLRGGGGALLAFPSSDARYSYAELDGDRVIRTAEKQVISGHALAGAYAFGDAAAFFELADAMVAEEARVANGEFYTSDLFNRLIRRGEIVRCAAAEEYWSFGTPEELAKGEADAGFLRFAVGRKTSF
jgi:dTDP-glucose pyrophosphorylase